MSEILRQRSNYKTKIKRIHKDSNVIDKRVESCGKHDDFHPKLLCRPI